MAEGATVSFKLQSDKNPLEVYDRGLSLEGELPIRRWLWYSCWSFACGFSISSSRWRASWVHFVCTWFLHKHRVWPWRALTRLNLASSFRLRSLSTSAREFIDHSVSDDRSQESLIEHQQPSAVMTWLLPSSFNCKNSGQDPSSSTKHAGALSHEWFPGWRRLVGVGLPTQIFDLVWGSCERGCSESIQSVGRLLAGLLAALKCIVFDFLYWFKCL